MSEMNCREIQEYLAEFGESWLKINAQGAKHIQHCEQCQEILAGLKLLEREIEDLPLSDVSEMAVQQVLEQVRLRQSSKGEWAKKVRDFLYALGERSVTGMRVALHYLTLRPVVITAVVAVLLVVTKSSLEQGIFDKQAMFQKVGSEMSASIGQTGRLEHDVNSQHPDLIQRFKDDIEKNKGNGEDTAGLLRRTSEDLRAHKERVTGIFETLVDKFEQLAREVDQLSLALKQQQEPPPQEPQREFEGPDGLDDIPTNDRKRPPPSASSRTPDSRPYYPEDNQSNYQAYEEQPRVRTVDEPSSTFSVDVDTASYTNARRFLTAGNLPPAASVRIEEFINYFDYNYPDQTDQPFSLTYEIAPSPLEKDRFLLLLGIKARAARAENKPWNIVFLIDTSGSMSTPERLALIQKGLRVLVQKMKPSDKVSIVTYAGSAELVLDATTVDESPRILAAIENLHAGGSTNGSGGIQLAYEVAQRNYISVGVNRVVLATDGDFNVGVTSNDNLLRIIEEKRKSGITLTTLGVGTDNFKDARLEQLANKGNGNYFYLDTFQEARHVLGEKIAGTIEVVAKDVKLQIEFNPQHVAQYRLIGYDNRKLNKEDFSNDAIDAGEIGVGHTVTALYEVVLTETELAQRLNTEYRYRQPAQTPVPVSEEELSSELAFLRIRHKEPEAAHSKLLEFPIEARRIKNNMDSASVDFKFASAVAYFGTILRSSKYVGNYAIADIVRLAEQSLGDDTKGQRREFVNLLKNAEAQK